MEVIPSQDFKKWRYSCQEEESHAKSFAFLPWEEMRFASLISTSPFTFCVQGQWVLHFFQSSQFLTSIDVDFSKVSMDSMLIFGVGVLTFLFSLIMFFAEASPRKRKSSSFARPSESGSSSSSHSPHSSSSSSNALPWTVLPNSLENSFARAREIDTKRRRTLSISSDNTSQSTHSPTPHKHNTMSIGHSSFFTGIGSVSGLGRSGPRTEGVTSSLGLSIASKSPIRRTGVQGKQPVKKLVIKNFTGMA